MEIVSGVHQIKVPLQIPNSPLGFVNTYLVAGTDGWTLIDTGWNARGSFEAFERQLKDTGLGFKDIRLILITHVHPDHFGLAGKYKELSGAKIAIHQAEKAFIESRYVSEDLLLEQMGQWLRRHGVPESESPRLQKASIPVKRFVVLTVPERTIAGGEVIDTGLFKLEVILTPGHSEGHVCFYERSKKLLFSGDHILPQTSPNISLHVQSPGNPLGDYLRSLKSMRGLEVELVLPGHEDVFTDLPQRIDELLKHHKDRSAAILDQIKDEAKTAYRIAQKVPWGLDRGGIAWEDMPNVDRRLAVTEALAHLEALVIEKKVRTFVRDGHAFYARV
ncbi:MAG: MBL fold metallo-hydrolase [Dehalococcoidia bacterium]|nr:MBL fold metallo-hydrolase [Dehalococcoidia bacterium]